VSGQRLTARDYKGGRRGALDLRRWKEFGLGLGAGLLVALVVFVSDRRHAESQAGRDPAAQRDASGTKGKAAARTGSDAASDGVADAAASGAGKYDFYNGLAKYEVVLPEREHPTRVDAAAKVEKPGTYFLQVGSYHNKAEADRISAQLARQDVVARVERVAIESDVWFRVRVGPDKDLAQINRTRQQLKAADFDPLVIRVGD
jgi:cell division protein FtsN